MTTLALSPGFSIIGMDDDATALAAGEEKPTAAVATPVDHAPQAYEYEPDLLWPPEPVASVSRFRWVVAIAALLGAAAALVFAAGFGIRAWHHGDASPPESTPEARVERTQTLTVLDKDSQFLQDLDSRRDWQVTAYWAVHDARATCRSLQAGASRDDLVQHLITARVAGDGTDRVAADEFITIAVAYYCPGEA